MGEPAPTSNRPLSVKLRGTPAPALVLGGVVGLQGGATIARLLFPIAGVPGVVTLRLGFGAVMLGGLRRPRLRMARRTLGLVVVVGVLLVIHHLAFYGAVDRLPLGVAVTLEFCGPLAVALAGSRRLLHVIWALLAAAGVVAASGFGLGGHFSGLGIAMALGAGTCWAGYIIVFPRLSQRMDQGQALASATIVAALISLPYGITVDHAGIFTWKALGLGAAVALLADVISYSLQAEALGRISGRLFSVLSSTEPAVGALFGLIALGQHMRFLQWLGVVAVVAASIGASLDS